MESWMVSLGYAFATGITLFIYNKANTEQNTRDIKKCEDNISKRIDKVESDASLHKRDDDKSHAAMENKIEKIITEIAEQKVKLETVPTAKDVDDKFVSKEFFRQVENNIYNRIDTSERHILASVEAMGKSLGSELKTITSNQMVLADKIEGVTAVRRKGDK